MLFITNFQIDWKVYFEEMFKGSSVHFNLRPDDKLILVPDQDYLVSIFKLLAKTPPHIIGKLDGIFYLFFCYSNFNNFFSLNCRNRIAYVVENHVRYNTLFEYFPQRKIQRILREFFP